MVGGECLMQVFLLIRLGAPSILVSASKHTKGLLIVRIFLDQALENVLRLCRGTHLSEGVGLALVKPVVIRIVFQRGAGGVVSTKKFAGGDGALHKIANDLGIVQPFRPLSPKLLESDRCLGSVCYFWQIRHSESHYPQQSCSCEP